MCFFHRKVSFSKVMNDYLDVIMKVVAEGDEHGDGFVELCWLTNVRGEDDETNETTAIHVLLHLLVSNLITIQKSIKINGKVGKGRKRERYKNSVSNLEGWVLCFTILARRCTIHLGGLLCKLLQHYSSKSLNST